MLEATSFTMRRRLSFSWMRAVVELLVVALLLGPYKSLATDPGGRGTCPNTPPKETYTESGDPGSFRNTWYCAHVANGARGGFLP